MDPPQGWTGAGTGPPLPGVEQGGMGPQVPPVSLHWGVNSSRPEAPMRPPLASQAPVKSHLSADPCQSGPQMTHPGSLEGRGGWARSHVDPEPLPVVLDECRPGSCWPWRRPLSLPAGASVLPYKHMLTRTHMCTHMYTCSRFSQTHRSASTHVNTCMCTTLHSVHALMSAHVDTRAARMLIYVHAHTYMQHVCSQTHRSVSTHDHTHVCHIYTVYMHTHAHTGTQMPAHTHTQHMYSQIDRSASTHVFTCMCTALHSVHTHRELHATHMHTQRETHVWRVHTHTQGPGCLPFPGQCLLSLTGHFPGF